VIDVGVHSLKDMPGELPDGLELACVPAREDPRDALLAQDGRGLAELPEGAVIGTSSLRRQALMRAYRADFQLRELRGNLDTRLRKLDEGQYDAIVLACAGLHRLGLAERITERLEPTVSVPAAGQGALALETRRGDTGTLALLAPLHDADTADAVTAERAFLAALGGGCTVPAGALATITQDTLHLLAVVVAPNGAPRLREEGRAARSEAEQLGRAVAARLLERGGRDLLKG
jgi:hydroxymethylbilane synthase